MFQKELKLEAKLIKLNTKSPVLTLHVTLGHSMCYFIGRFKEEGSTDLVSS